MIRRQFIQTLFGLIPMCFSLPARSKYGKKENLLPDMDGVFGDEYACQQSTMVVGVRVDEVCHYPDSSDHPKIHENFDGFMEINLKCIASNVSGNFQVDIHFYNSHRIAQKKMKDLTIGSEWMVSGFFDVIDGDICLYGPDYRGLLTNEKLVIYEG